jgi:diaminopimelate dehydrogenase
MKIKIAICGYGNLGKGVEAEIVRHDDMELVAVFTRRKLPEALSIKSDVPVVAVEDAVTIDSRWKKKVDVMILCGGSAKDLPEQSPLLAEMYNIVDSYDTHAKIAAHMQVVDAKARQGERLAVISAGWDPGLFSLMRLYGESIIPHGATASFWGYGVSQGHSDAIRCIEGVVDAVQYTIPIEEAIEKARHGEAGVLLPRDRHRRVCYVAVAAEADKVKIEQAIINMPHYFADYDTSVIFATVDELRQNHASLPHGGQVIRVGETGTGHRQLLEFGLKLESNPEFTASVLLAYARAAYRLHAEGQTGARTVFDIAPRYLFAPGVDEAISRLL